MIIINCQQGTDEWKKARCGVITASRFRDATDTLKNGKPTEKSVAYAAQIAMERISGQPCDEGFTTWEMKRGNELEPKARMQYEIYTGRLAQESGIALTDDRLFGYSTDGFIYETGCIEIKCPASPKKVIALWETDDLSEYIHQIQGGLWITGRQWCDFLMYAPQLEAVNKALYIETIQRDDAFIEKLEKDLMAFAQSVAQKEAVLKREKKVVHQEIANETLLKQEAA